jgi:type II pantothenate kinase
MTMAPPVIRELLANADALPGGCAGIDAGMTLTKIARRTTDGVEFVACETDPMLGSDQRVSGLIQSADTIGVTGARGGLVGDGSGLIRVQEIDAAAHGAIVLMAHSAPSEFLLALMGTGTAFAAVRHGSVTHLGGTAMGGGSFSAIARLIEPKLGYREIVAAAALGDRRNCDMMVSDAYAGGIGRISADLTAAHLAKSGGSSDDFLAALINMHGENMAQIAAGRCQAAGLRQVVLCGGFVHANTPLVASMKDMLRLFGLECDVAPHAGFAGALGAALIASERRSSET